MHFTSDCPGFGVRGDSEYDHKLFTLTYLLSSLMIFTSRGPITENTFTAWQPIKTLTNFFQVAEEHDAEQNDFNMVYYAPKLLWIIRDSESLGRDSLGKAVIADQHLDYALHTKSIAGSNTDTQSKINEYIKSRECISFPGLKNSNTEEYESMIFKLRERIFSKSTCKQMDGLNLSCAMFTTFINEVVEAINGVSLRDPKPFSLYSIWDVVIEKECALAFMEGTEYHKLELKNHFMNQEEPYPEAYLDSLMKKIRDDSISKYTKLAYLSQTYDDVYNDYLQRLQDHIDAKESLVYDLNDKLAKE